MVSKKSIVKKINYIYNDDGLFILTVYVPCGSIYEHVGEFKGQKLAGMSHFLEHLLFKHTENFSGQQILKAFTQIGGYYNASTDKDQTMYYVKTLTENYQLATTLLYDIVAKPIFQEHELEVERKIVLEELASSKDNLTDVVYEQSTTTLLGKDNPYLPSVIGTQANLKGITTREVLKYYRAHYDNVMVVIDCDRKVRNEVQRFVTKLFGVNQPISFYNSAFEAPSLRFIHDQSNRIQLVPSETYQYNTSILFPSFKFADVHKHILLNFVKFCLSDAGLYSIMTYEIREKRGLVYSIRMTNERMRYTGVFRITFGTSNKDLVGILDVMLSIMSDLKQFGLSKKNLAYFKTSYKNHLKYKFANEEFRASWVGDNLFYGCPISVSKFFQMIDDIDNTHFMTTCRKVFVFNRMGIYSTGAYNNIRTIKKEIVQLIETHNVYAKKESNSVGHATVE